MTSPRTEIAETAAPGSSVSGPGTSPLGLLSTLLLSAWCGLVAGLLEVATILLRKALFDSNQLYGMSRHFVWMIPLFNLCLFIALGVLGCAIRLERAGHGRRLFSRVLCALTLLPIALVAFPQIYSLAWFVVALGAGMRLVPWLERHARFFRRIVQVSFPLAVGIVAILWASLWVPDRTRQSQENARPLPPSGSPNVLLIVMDTVAAGHLSLYGYHRRHQHNPDRAGRARQSNSISHRRRRHGRCRRMRRCLPDDGCTSCRSAGSRHSTKRVPRWPSFWERRATRRPGSWPTPPTVPAIRAWTAALPTTGISSSPN